MKCPNCGSDNAPGSRFCYNCGTSLAAAAATDTPPASPDLLKKPSDTPPAQPPAQPPVERTVVMSLPPNMFPPPPANVPPASNIPPGGATQASDFPPYAPTQAGDATVPPFNPPPPPPSGAPAGTSAATGPKRAGLAVAALVCGILAISVICSLGVIMPLVAIVLGFIARGQVAKSGGSLTGGGMAVAGIVLGFIGLIINVLLIVLSFLPMLAALGGA